MNKLAGFPARFPTGIRKTTIANPAQLEDSFDAFEGRPEDYNWNRFYGHYVRLNEALKRHGTKISHVAGAWHEGDTGYPYYSNTNHHCFVACDEKGLLMWERYVGHSATGSQNRVYVSGQMMNLSVFMALSFEQQVLLFSGADWSDIRGR